MRNNIISLILILILVQLLSVPQILYSSNGKLNDYLIECKNFLEKKSKQSVEQLPDTLIELVSMHTLCDHAKIKAKLTQEEKTELNVFSSELEKKMKSVTQDKLKKLEQTVAFAKATLEMELREELTQQDIEELDVLLQAKWKEMRTALAQDDIDKAVSYFHSMSKEIYRKQFSAFPPEIKKEIAKDFANIHFDHMLGHSTVIYEILTVRNGKRYSQQLTFIRDFDGKWYIKSF